MSEYFDLHHVQTAFTSRPRSWSTMMLRPSTPVDIPCNHLLCSRSCPSAVQSFCQVRVISVQVNCCTCVTCKEYEVHHTKMLRGHSMTQMNLPTFKSLTWRQASLPRKAQRYNLRPMALTDPELVAHFANFVSQPSEATMIKWPKVCA